MFSRRMMLNLLVASMMTSAAGAGPAPKKQHHKNGHNLVKEKLKQNGRHQIDKAGQATVSVDVNNGKVTAMSAAHPQKGNLPVRKVKSRRKMAVMEDSRIHIAAGSDGAQFAQLADYYYAWCFDVGIDEYCYWYPADVVIVDTSWVG